MNDFVFQGDSDVDHVSSSSGKKQVGSDQENIVQLVQVSLM